MMFRRIALFLSLFLVHSLAAAEIGVVKSAEGDVRVTRSGHEIPIRTGDRIEPSDIVVTGADGRIGITFIDGARFSLGPGSRIELEKFRFDAARHQGEFKSRLKKGTLAVISGQIAKSDPDAMKVATPSSVLAVRGTRFLVKVDESTTASQ